MLFILGGAFFGNVLGSWFSLVAIKLIHVGIATTIMATTPIVILPMVIWGHKEKVSWKAAIGAVIAVIGIAILLNA